jgi:hypothetical protein
VRGDGACMLFTIKAVMGPWGCAPLGLRIVSTRIAEAVMTGQFGIAGLALTGGGKLAEEGSKAGRVRRASQRFKAKPGSMVCYVEGSGAIRDLSMDGVFLLDSEPLPADTKIRFSVRLGNETVWLQGIVRRSVAREGMGIQFTDVPGEIRRRLVTNFASLA